MIARALAVVLTVGLGVTAAVPAAAEDDEAAGSGANTGFALLRPIRTNEPGTGVFIGSGALVRLVTEGRSRGEESFRDTTLQLDFRYTPATHWVLGVAVPLVLDRHLNRPGLARQSSGGPGDVTVSVKHRFFRSVGRWSDRHAAVELDVKLPTGSSARDLDPRLPIQRRMALQPGTGSTDLALELVYQEGRQRFVYGGDIGYRLNTRGSDRYRFGNELRVDLDFEYILFPLEYRRPGKEVFVLLEATFVSRAADDVGGREVAGTRRTELFLAPGIQHILTEQMLVSASLQLPVYSDVPAPGLERDLNLLTEVRYAF